MKRKWAISLVLLIVALQCAIVWRCRPLPPRTRDYVANGISYHVVSTREFQWLPFAKWGIGSYGVIGCGSGNKGEHFSESISSAKVGFFIVIDREKTRYGSVKLP